MKINRVIYYKWNRSYEEKILMISFKDKEIGISLSRFKRDGKWVYSLPSVYSGLVGIEIANWGEKLFATEKIILAKDDNEG